MRKRREKLAPAFVDIAGNACASGLSHTIASFNRRRTDVVAMLRRRQKARRADSESRVLAIKKFSCSPASRLIAARQNRFFGRIATADSRCAFHLAPSSRRMIGDRRVLAHTQNLPAAKMPAAAVAPIQMPSLDFSRSLTACGLALPPDDFITWPTNQPIS
jgi:hypothetical protein